MNVIRQDNSIFISQDYLLSQGVSANYLRVAKSRSGRFTDSWSHATINNVCYFQYNSLPRSTTARLETYETLNEKAVETHNYITEIVQTARLYGFKAFLKSMTHDEAVSMAVISEASRYVHNNGISFRKSAFFEALANEIRVQNLKYLPVSWRNLRDKIENYTNGVQETAIVKAKNRGNQNRAILKPNEDNILLTWLLDLGRDDRNYSYAFIWRKLRNLCAQHSIKSPSERWVTGFLAKPETQSIIHKKYGKNSRFNHKYRAYTPTKSALYAGDCWDIDGTRVNIIDHHARITNKEGKRVSARKFLYIVVVRDVMSGLPLGWEYCYEESEQAVNNALAMAVRNTMYLPYEIRYDRFPGHNTERWLWLENALRQKGVIMTQTSKAEGKATTERWFGTLQSVFMAESPLYYGEGIKSSRSHAHRSKEYVQKMHKWAMQNGFNFDDACNETDRIIENYCSTKFSDWSTKYKHIDKTPIELHADCTKPNVSFIEKSAFCYLFGLKKSVAPANFMIKTEIEKATYYYGIDDYDVIEQYTGVKLLNCFDYEDLDTVYLFDGNKLVGSFSRIEPAQQYGKNKDMRAVGKLQKIARGVDERRMRRLAELSEVSAHFADSEVDILLSGKISKQSYETAETAFLHNDWELEECEELEVSVQNRY